MASADSSNPTQVVLCLPVLRGLTGEQVLLGLKQRGFGAGRVVAPGGKIEPGENPAQAAIRELHEETGLEANIDTLARVARVYFRFPSRQLSDMDCTVFIIRDFSGMATPSEELVPAWYPVGHLPLAKMWDDSALWLGKILAGERFDAHVTLADDNESVANFFTEAWPENKMPSQPATNQGLPDIT